MDSFKAIIETVGIAQIAELFGIKESHVRVMKTRDSIPAEYWGILIESFDEITYAKLRKLHDARFRKAVDTVAA